MARIKHRFSVGHILRRLDTVRAIERRDVNRFKPNPLGEGYLTRWERYNELYWELERRLSNAALNLNW